MRFMQHSFSSERDAVEESSFFRRSVMAMAMIAAFSYVVAFVQADRGTVYYDRYITAFTECFHHGVDTGAARLDCNSVPAIREALILHREAFAVGEPFLNLALSLSVAVLLSPLFRRISNLLMDRVSISTTANDAA
ncbi:MAG: hypothetical protein AAGI24_09770 [Pseudomonadota bacterium]